MPHIVIFRTGANVLDLNTYNCQELGLAKELTNKGFRVSLVMAGHENRVERFMASSGFVNVHYLKFFSIDQRYGYFIGYDKILQDLRPDVLQIHDLGIYMTWKVARWAKKNAVPYYLIQGTYCLSSKPIIEQMDYLFSHTFGKYVVRNATGIGCKTIAAATFVKSIYNRKTCLTYIGLDESKFSAAKSIDWRNNLNITGKHVLLYVGVLEKRRNPLFLLNLMKRLPDNFILLMAGKGPLQTEIAKKIKHDGLSDKVVLLGKLSQEELPSLYRQADLLLLPSSYEIYGMVILESMYFELPVISSCTAGAETIIENNVDGVIVTQFEVDLWQKCILSVCSDKFVFQNMKITAGLKINKHFVWRKAVDNFINLYNNDNNRIY